MNEYRQTKDAVYEVPKYDPKTGELNPDYEELTGEEIHISMNYKPCRFCK